MTNIFRIGLVSVICIFTLTQCTDDFAEKNVDPFNPTQTSANFLFNGILSKITQPGNHNLYLENARLYQWSQLAANSSNCYPPEDLIAAVHDFGRSAAWNHYFGTLRDIRELEKRLDNYEGDQERNRNRRALLNIMHAYYTLRTTDIYGDMPYSDAGRGVEDGNQIFRPKYDSQETIYKDALAKLEWASDNIITDKDARTPGGETYFNYGNSEVLYSNDMKIWEKLANTLLLRYALRISDADGSLAQSLGQKAISRPLPEDDSEVLVLGSDINGIGGRGYWAWQYCTGIRMGENVWNHMSENDERDGSGIFDPRVYIYFETNGNNEWKALPQSPFAQEAAYTDDLGANHPYNDKRRADPTGFEYRGEFSGLNWWVVEDDQNGDDYQTSYAEVALMVAEAAALGWTSESAQEWYEKGMKASVVRWYTQQTNPDIDVVLPTPDEDALNAFVSHPKVAWDDSKAIQLIHVQRWLDYFLNVNEGWALMRRTNGTTIPFIPTQDRLSGNDVPLVRRVLYPPDEFNNNAENYAAVASKDDFFTKMWWDTK